MTKEELLTKLRALAKEETSESGHFEADELLIEWINDPEIAEAYEAVGKWYK